MSLSINGYMSAGVGLFIFVPARKRYEIGLITFEFSPVMSSSDRTLFWSITSKISLLK